MKIDVSHVAKLASLTLTDEEKVKFEKQLSETLTYVEKLKEVNTTGVEETSQITELENVTREDQATDCTLSQEEALLGTKSTENGFFKVKGILPSE